MGTALTRESQRLRDAFNYLFQEELEFLYSVTETLPPDPVIVNIGAGAGTSGLAFLEARPDSKVYTIDVTKDDSPYGSLTAEWLSANIAGVLDRLTQLHGDSVVIGGAWKHEELDLIFVDGNHSYEGCAGDMAVWSRLLKPGGYLLVHDYDKDRVYKELGNYDKSKYPHPRSLPGVDQAVNEAIETGELGYRGALATIAIFRRVE